jgi:hypothetical protein
LTHFWTKPLTTELLKNSDKIFTCQMKNVRNLINLVFARLTSMDFDPVKMIVALGYNDGSIEVLNIEKSSEGSSFYFLVKELRVLQR